MNQILNRWTPSSDVLDHAGTSLTPDSIFFAPPPVEIGRVLTAHSGMRASGLAVNRPISRKVIVLFTLFGIALGVFLGAGFAHGHWPGVLVGMLLGALLIGGPIYRRESHSNDCTYTGENGIARFRYGQRNASHPRAEVFLFADAVDLQTALLGRKGGTNFNYQWKNAAGKTLYKLEGGYYGTKQQPDLDALYQFARAAEVAWGRLALQRAQEEMRRQGSCRFLIGRGIGNKQYAVIGPGYLDIINTKEYRNLAGEIDDIVLHRGWIIIRRKDARQKAVNSLDGRDGIFYLSYGSVSNVRTFLVLIEQMLGVRCRNSE